MRIGQHWMMNWIYSNQVVGHLVMLDSGVLNRLDWNFHQVKHKANQQKKEC